MLDKDQILANNNVDMIDLTMGLIKENNNKVRVPKGTIIIKAGAVPLGWVLCDGTNGTPNLVANQIGSTIFIMKT
jgi:hypothetical protein